MASATYTLHTLISEYEQAGLPVETSKTAFPTDSLSFLGIHLDGQRGLLLLDTTKLTDLLHATSWALSIRHLSFKHLQCLIGHWVWLFLLRRPFFSFLYATYRFLSAFPKHISLPPIWASVQAELSALPHVAPFLFANLRRPPADTTLESDASLSGGGATKTALSTLPSSFCLGW